MRLNLGSGDNAAEGWLNVDIVQRLAPVDLFADVRRLPFGCGSVEQVYAGHLLEHMFPGESRPAVAHWFDLLEPGGELGVLVPDVQQMWRMHRDAGHWSLEELDGAIGRAGRDPDDPFALHVTIWTPSQLADFVWSITGRPVEEMDRRCWPVNAPEWDWQRGVVVTKP